MPIEIRELHIRVSVHAGAGGHAAGASGGAPADGSATREALVAECVEQVLEVLRDERER